MKKIVLILGALAALTVAGVAYASINTYPTASLSFSTKKAGTPAKPVPIGYTQKIVAKGTPPNRTAVLTDILTKIYGLKADGKDFPQCSAAKISAAGDDTGCPKGAMVATGKLKFRESIANGIASAPEAFIGLLKGKNFGKQLVKLV